MQNFGFIFIILASILGIVMFGYTRKINTITLGSIAKRSRNYTIHRGKRTTKIALAILSLVFITIASSPIRLDSIDQILSKIGLQNIEVQGRKILFVMDVSKSMNTEDAPDNQSRLDFGKGFLREFVKKHSENSYGILVFGSGTMVLSPYSQETTTVLTSIDSLSTSLLQDGGSDLVGATLMAEKTSVSNSGSLIVILSDGGEKEEFPTREQFKNDLETIVRKTPVVSLGIGSEKGGQIPIGTDVFGQKIYRMWNNEPAVSRLQSDSLSQIAAATNGNYQELRSIERGEQAILRILDTLPTEETETHNKSFGSKEFFLFLFVLFGVCSLSIVDKIPLGRNSV